MFFWMPALPAFGATSQNVGISETFVPNDVSRLQNFVFNFVIFLSRFVTRDKNLQATMHRFAPNEAGLVIKRLLNYLRVSVV